MPGAKGGKEMSLWSKIKKRLKIKKRKLPLFVEGSSLSGYGSEELLVVIDVLNKLIDVKEANK